MPLPRRRDPYFASSRQKAAQRALQYGTSDEEEDDPWGDESEEDLDDECRSHARQSASTREVASAQSSVPTIFKTADGACTVETELDGVRNVRELVQQVVRTGQADVDPQITASGIRLHFLASENARPKRVTRTTNWTELRGATALIVTPSSDN